MTTTLLDYLKESNFGKQTLLDILINGNQYPVKLRNQNPDFSSPTQQITNLRTSQYDLRLQYGMRSIESGIITDLSLYGNNAAIDGILVPAEFFTPVTLGVAIILTRASTARSGAGDASVAVICDVTVTDASLTIYTEDIAYTIDIIAGTITPTITGGMNTTTEYKITYTYYVYGRGQNQYALHLNSDNKVTCQHSDSVNLTDAMTLIAVSDNISSGDLIKKGNSYHIETLVTHVEPSDDYSTFTSNYNSPVTIPDPLEIGGMYNVIVESVGGTLYVEGTDYAVDNKNGTITVLDFDDSSMADSTLYNVTYDRYVCNAGVYIPDSSMIPISTLHELTANIHPGFTHIALTYSSSSKFKQLRLYVDSKLATYENMSEYYSNSIVENSSPVFFGDGMEVILDEVAIYGEGLKHKEVVADYYYRDDKLSGSIVRGGGSTPSVYFEGLTDVTVVDVDEYTLLLTDYLLDVKRTTTGACLITIPVSECYYGRTFRVKDSGGNAFTNNITVVAAGGQLFEGLASILIRDNYRGLEFYFNGTQFMIMSMK